jgi:hypothetical protein
MGHMVHMGQSMAYLSCSVAISGFTPLHGAHGAHAKIIELPSKLDPGNAGNVFLNLGHGSGAVPESEEPTTPALAARRPWCQNPAMKFLVAFFRRLLHLPEPKPAKRILSRWTPI